MNSTATCDFCGNEITEVKKIHPDVIFMSTNELGKLINMVDL